MPPETSGSPSDPPCRVLVRSKEGLEIYTTPERATDAVPTGDAFLMKGPFTFHHCVPDGSVAYVQVVGHGIVQCFLNQKPNGANATSLPVFLEDSKGVQMMDISPNGTYILTWERAYDDKPNNLKLWEASTGKLLAAFPQKALKREAWPYLQWTPDELYALLHSPNEVRVYPAKAFETDGRYSERLRIADISSISLPAKAKLPDGASTGIGPYFFTSFCPATKDKPAKASLHAYVPNAAANSSKTYPALLSKSLFQAEEMKVHWSPIGDAALITLQTSVDTTGQSYYGSSHLFLLAATAKSAIAVPLPQEGPVLDVQWMPHPDKPPCFLAVAGRMPALASLHHGQTGDALFQFGNAHRNTIAWSPHGRFLCLAGFGNLAGGMSFWDRNKKKLCSGSAVNAAGQLRADAVVGYEWSPDSRLFVVCTTTPRMNVDNGMRLFRYSGEELTSVPWDNARYRPDKLLQVSFVPALLKTYPDRPQSPPPEGTEAVAALMAAPAVVRPAASVPGTPAPAAAAAAAKPRSAYVPPSARKRDGGGSSLAERMRREKEGSSQQAGKVAAPKVKSAVTGKSVVGLSSTDAGKSKSALKREKAKKKKEEEEARQKLAQQAQPAQTPEPTPVESVDPEKRARKIKKTLKQIDDLKTKDPGSLNDDQKSKIASEAGLLEELAKLGL